jgi:hypothetical protein
MYHDLVNPFAQFGNIIHGPDFIGRKEALEIIESRVVRPLEVEAVWQLLAYRGSAKAV